MGIRGHGVRGWLVLVAMISLSACAVADERALVESMQVKAEEAYFEAGAPPLGDLLAAPAIGIVGTVTGVDPGVGVWRDPAPDGDGAPYIVDIQDSDAHATTSHLVVKVDRLVFGPGPGEGDIVTAGVMVEGAMPTEVGALFEGARLFMVLGPAGEGLWEYQPDVRGIALDGTFIARTGSDGELDFFAFSDEIVTGLGLDGLTASAIGDLADR
ncbi:MAG: hypothetical protein ACFCVC_06230 [Acidimicrobiia bacterium]